MRYSSEYYSDVYDRKTGPIIRQDIRFNCEYFNCEDIFFENSVATERKTII